MVNVSRPRRNKLTLLPASFLLAVLILIAHSLSAQSACVELSAAYCKYDAGPERASAATVASSNLCLMRPSWRGNAYTPWCAKFGSQCVSQPFESFEAANR
jgi:hypothetical protein